MAKKNRNIWPKVGVWSYVVGLVLAVLVGLIAGLQAQWAVITLVVLGVVVGLLNIGDTEVREFLLATVAFVISGIALAGVFASFGWQWLVNLMNAIIVFTAPGALVVSFRALYNVARDK